MKEQITHHPVKSSTIKEVGHDPEQQALYVRFHGGGHYKYHGVDSNTFHALMAAPSKGKFLHKMVKPKHKFTKLKE